MTSIEDVRRFVHEGILLARLEHSNVVRVYEVGQWHDADVDRPFIAMEYIGPQNLVRYATDQTADVRQKLQLLTEVCSGVGHAHARGIIHCDLKPGNVMVDAEGRPKVLDFGVAKAVSGETTMHTTGSQWLGTPPYMSPEQFTHAPDDIDERCDVYALGAIGYELLSGDAPFRCEGRSVAQIIHDIFEQDPPRLGSIDARLAGDVETVIAKALQKRSEDRYETVADFAADLRALLENRPITAQRSVRLVSYGVGPTATGRGGGNGDRGASRSPDRHVPAVRVRGYETDRGNSATPHAREPSPDGGAGLSMRRHADRVPPD